MQQKPPLHCANCGKYEYVDVLKGARLSKVTLRSLERLCMGIPRQVQYCNCTR
jgi:hypothetical protein